MTVTLIAHTQTIWNPRKMPGKAADSAFAERLWNDSWQDYKGVMHNQEIIEFAGRLCYESFHLPNPKTQTQAEYIAQLINLGHFSVLEHASASFYVEKVSRNLSHELIRHRHLSFSEMSQRYVDLSEANFIIPPAVYDAFEDDEKPEHRYETIAGTEHAGYYEAVMEGLKDAEVKGKKAREAARYYMPAGLETKFVVSGNLRAWYDVILKRLRPEADAEMQLFAQEIWEALSKTFPDVFREM